MITTVLFDLDGTLLPMDNEKFTTGYFKLLAKKMAPYGYDAKLLVPAIWEGVKSMVLNDNSMSNEEAFYKTFSTFFGERVYQDIPKFTEFYENEFNQAQSLCGYNPKSKEVVCYLKEKGIDMILATNPLFPRAGTLNRIRWAGLNQDDFSLITAYENIGYCKPNLKYYEEILRRQNKKPEECLMVGNDVDEDMIASKLGLSVFLVTDCLLNKRNKDVSSIPHGDMDDLLRYLKEQGI